MCVGCVKLLCQAGSFLGDGLCVQCPANPFTLPGVNGSSIAACECVAGYTHAIHTREPARMQSLRPGHLQGLKSRLSNSWQRRTRIRYRDPSLPPFTQTTGWARCMRWWGAQSLSSFDAARTGGSNNRVEHMSWSTSEALSFGKIWRQRFLKRFVTGTRTAGGCEGVYCSFIPTRGASSALLVPSEVRPCETKLPEETSFVELEHACRPHVFSMQPPFRPRVCSLQPVLHPTDEMDETMYDETTTTIYDTFADEVGGELAAIGDSIGHARGDMLQVRQDEHMRDEMRSEMDSGIASAITSGITLADTMTSAGDDIRWGAGSRCTLAGLAGLAGVCGAGPPAGASGAASHAVAPGAVLRAGAPGAVLRAVASRAVLHAGASRAASHPGVPPLRAVHAARAGCSGGSSGPRRGPRRGMGLTLSMTCRARQRPGLLLIVYFDL